MVSHQQLEKLWFIKRSFAGKESLEAIVAVQRIDRLIDQTEQILKQRTFLREERRILRDAAEKINDRKIAVSVIRRKDWIPLPIRLQVIPNLLLNLDGMIFEISYTVARKDKSSLLYALTSPTNTILPDEQGYYFFKRDWWLFRFVLRFLRDGILPNDRGILSQLYKEAEFWQLLKLQEAIEEQKLHLRDVKTLSSDKNEEQWWRSLPDWLTTSEMEELKTNTKKPVTDDKDSKDWWKSSSYHGKIFLSDNKDNTNEKEKKGLNQVISSTWSLHS